MEHAALFRVVLKTPDGEQAVECAGDEFVWDAAARSGVVLPAICHQGRCLTCAARLVEGEVDQSASASYLAEDREAGFMLPCTGRPLSALVLQTHQQWAMHSHRKMLGLPAPYA